MRAKGTTGTGGRLRLPLASIAAVLLLGLAACGGSSSNDGASAPQGGGSAPADVEIDREASLTITHGGSAASLDPHRQASAGSWPWLWPIFDRLTQIDETKELKPMLATDWEFSEDGLTLTMNLREGVTFNDGTTPVDAEAVKASIERAQTLPDSLYTTNLAGIDSIDAVSPTQVQFNLNRQSGDLPVLFASLAGSVINPTLLESGDDIGLDPGDGIGSGPMVVTDFRPSVSIRFERADDDYWEEEANNLAQLTILNISDDAPRMNNFRSGQADVMQVKIPQLEEAQSIGSGDGKVFYQTDIFQGHFSVSLRGDRSELDKLEVRQALNYAIDRESIANDLLGGACQVTTQPFPPGEVGYDEELEDFYTYDPDRARDLLESVGLEDGFDLVLTTVTVSPQMEMTQVLMDQFSEIGVNVTIEPTPVANGQAQFNTGTVDTYASAMTGQPDPAIFFDNLFIGGARLSTPAAPEMADLAESAKDRTGGDEWQDTYAEMSRIAIEKALYVPICFVPALWLANDDVSNVPTMPWQTTYTFDTRYLAKTK